MNGSGTSRQLFEHNLAGVVNVLEYCKVNRAGFILLSTSRGYSIRALEHLPVCVQDGAFRLDCSNVLPRGVSVAGINVAFPTEPPVSLIASTRLWAEAPRMLYRCSSSRRGAIRGSVFTSHNPIILRETTTSRGLSWLQHARPTILAVVAR